MYQEFRRMIEKVKFTQVSRVICPRTGIHYLDAISQNGEHYVAEMKSGIERWLIFSSPWKKIRTSAL
jgi:hypothetical protein